MAVISLLELSEEFGARADALADWTPAMSAVAELMEIDQAARFVAGVDPQGIPWSPVRFPQVPGNPPLVGRTGSLAASFAPGGPGHVREVGPDSAAVGSRHPLAAAHSRGYTAQRPERRRSGSEKPWVWQTPAGPVFTRRIMAHGVYLPARELGGISPEALDRIRGVLGAYLQRGSTQAVSP